MNKWISLFDSFNDMKTRISFSNVGYFADFQAECNLFKWLLHLSTRKWSQISATFGWTAVWVFLCQFGQSRIAWFNLENATEEAKLHKKWLPPFEPFDFHQNLFFFKFNERKFFLVETHFLVISIQNSACLFFGACNIFLTPWAWAAAIFVFYQQMSALNLARIFGWITIRLGWWCWQLPLRFFRVNIQIIR